LRCDFITQHLSALAEALDNGMNVIGYLYWSLIDNYEWALGTDPHFGLAAVNLTNQERSPRPCVEVFKRLRRENRPPN
jgi:beta-glucosidase/6-phospho-beta-glucosidase/beta-galactosidase